MTQEEHWLLDEKYQGEKTEVLKLLENFIEFLHGAKLEIKQVKTSEVNTHSESEYEIVLAKFCEMRTQNEQKLVSGNVEIFKKLLADVERLKAGEPLAYVIGHIPFLNTTIHLDSHPLIPRTETEYWVEHILLNIKIADSPNTRVLDLCAGSGCVGVAVLKNTHSVRVDFAEIESKHHTTIQKNIELNDIDLLRTNIIGGNLFEHIENIYDFILTNPPYIDKALDRTEASVKNHEPHEALYADEAGLAHIKTIITTGHRYLKPNGTLLIEHEPEQSKAIANIARDNHFVSSTFEDQYGVERYTVLTRETP